MMPISLINRYRSSGFGRQRREDGAETRCHRHCQGSRHAFVLPELGVVKQRLKPLSFIYK